MGIALETKSYIDNGAGLDLKSSPTKVAENAASLSLNIDYSVDGAFGTRNGSTIQNKTAGIPAQISGAPTILGGFDFKKSDGTQVNVLYGSDGKIYHDLVTPVAIVTGLTTGGYPDFQPVTTGDDEYLLFGDGVNTNLKFNGTIWTNLSLPRPILPSAVDNGAGNLSAGVYDYYVSYAVLTDGVIVQESELSPVGVTASLAAGRQTTVTFTACSETLATGVTAQCNARVLYRNTQTDGEVYRLTTIANNVTLTYDDNISDADLIAAGILAEFDNQAAPTSGILETDDYGQTWFVDASRTTDTYTSKAYKPWNVPTDNITIFDGPLRCSKRCFGTLVFGTDRSLWVQNGSFATTDARKFSSVIGIANNRCAVGESSLYIFSTSKKVYAISPTDFSQNELRIGVSISDKVDPLLKNVSDSNIEKVCMEYYTKPGVGKVMISAPIGSTNNDRLVVYNEEQSIAEGSACWQYWDNIKAAFLKQMVMSNGFIGLYSGDYNGFVWLLDDSSTNGDGAEENGTVTSATTTTITDSSQTWTVNELVGCVVRTVDGYAENEVATVTSNTATEITFTPAFSATPNTTTRFTVGGYDTYHFTNWKAVLASYETLKQMWFIWVNANASGDYTIKLISQYDFNETLSDQTELNISLVAGNAIWGEFLWGDGIWGSQSVFEDRFRQLARFRAARFGFYNRYAGQPFQINTFSLSCQNKGLFFRST